MRRLLPLSNVITRDIMTSIRCIEWLKVAEPRRRGMAAVSSAHWRYRSVSRSVCGETPQPRRPKAATGTRNQTENGNRKDGLAAGRRGASKEGRMPVSDDRVNFKRHWSRGVDSDEDSRSHQGHDGHDGMHRDA